MGTPDTWIPEYAPWRHGGWYVTNIKYPNGAVGCVSRNFPDRKWRIVCDPRPNPLNNTYESRDAAARAERDLVAAMSADDTVYRFPQVAATVATDGDAIIDPDDAAPITEVVIAALLQQGFALFDPEGTPVKKIL